MNAVEIHNLSHSYPDGTPSLRQVSLTVHVGESVAVLGPNGAGKSTLLWHLNGLIRNHAAVRIHGQPLEKKYLDAIRRRVGLVFQDPEDQLFMPRVFDDVAFGLLCRGESREGVASRVAEALRKVGVAGFEERSPHHLSLGEKKRVALATVLALDCDLLVLDEPTAGLDPRGRRHLIQLLQQLKLTKIIATHDLALARELCERAVLLDGGEVVADRQIDELLEDDELLQAHGLERFRGR